MSEVASSDNSCRFLELPVSKQHLRMISSTCVSADHAVSRTIPTGRLSSVQYNRSDLISTESMYLEKPLELYAAEELNEHCLSVSLDDSTNDAVVIKYCDKPPSLGVQSESSAHSSHTEKQSDSQSLQCLSSPVETASERSVVPVEKSVCTASLCYSICIVCCCELTSNSDHAAPGPSLNIHHTCSPTTGITFITRLTEICGADVTRYSELVCPACATLVQLIDRYEHELQVIKLKLRNQFVETTQRMTQQQEETASRAAPFAQYISDVAVVVGNTESSDITVADDTCSDVVEQPAAGDVITSCSVDERQREATGVDGRVDDHMCTHTCTECGRSFSSSHGLDIHQRVHRQPCGEACGECERVFDSRGKLRRHVQRCHNLQPIYPCTVCGKLFRTADQRNTHTKYHGDQRPHVCPHCHKRFVQVGDLNKHVRIHSGQRSYVCDICGKAFSRSDVLKTHIAVHSGRKPFTCDVCGRTFSQNSDLRRHFRIHSGDLPYKCNECDVGFRRREQLNTHKARHGTAEAAAILAEAVSKVSTATVSEVSVGAASEVSTATVSEVSTATVSEVSTATVSEVSGGVASEEAAATVSEVPAGAASEVAVAAVSGSVSRRRGRVTAPSSRAGFACDQCGKVFTRRSSLEVHRRCHTGERPFCCEHCGRLFVSSAYLTSHRRIMHADSKRHGCTLCQKWFATAALLAHHVRYHAGERAFKCNKCTKTFVRPGDLRAHVRCRHASRTPPHHQCCHCGSRFTTDSLLLVHVQRVHPDQLEPPTASVQPSAAAAADDTPTRQLQQPQPDHEDPFAQLYFIDLETPIVAGDVDVTLL